MNGIIYYPQDRLHWKIEIVKGLYERGYDRATILEMFRFIDWLMVLPVELEQGFQRIVDEYEEATKMRYVTSIERMAEARGIEQGIEQGTTQTVRKNILQALALRFVNIPEHIAPKLNETKDIQLLDMLFKQAILSASLDEFIRTLDKIKQNNQAVENSESE